MSKPTYSFDTSALIDWWVRHYPPDILPSLIINVETVIAEGRFKASRYVLTEVEQGGDELQGWAKFHKDQIFIEEDEAAQKIACSLIKKYSFSDNPEKGRAGADPFVIARAQLGNPVVWTVVSGEKPTDANSPKSPYLSGQLDVLTFRQFSEKEGVVILACLFVGVLKTRTAPPPVNRQGTHVGGLAESKKAPVVGA